MSTWINNWLRPEVFCTYFSSNSGRAQERSEYPKAPNSGHRLARPTRSPKALRLIDETCAVRFLQRGGQRPILLAVRPANRSDPTQMILRLIAVALLDLPQTVILPGQHMIRICFQGALVPDSRKLVVAEFAIGITDQIGHVRMIVVAERPQLLDGVGIFIAVIDGRIGFAVTLGKSGVVEKGLLGFFGLGDLSGLLARRLLRPRRTLVPRVRRSVSTTTTPPPPPAPKAGVNEAGAFSAIRNVASVTILITKLVIRTSRMLSSPDPAEPVNSDCCKSRKSNVIQLEYSATTNARIQSSTVLSVGPTTSGFPRLIEHLRLFQTKSHGRVPMSSAAARAKHRHQRLIGFAAYRAVSLNCANIDRGWVPLITLRSRGALRSLWALSPAWLALQARLGRPVRLEGPPVLADPDPLGPGSLPHPASASAMLTANIGKVLTPSPLCLCPTAVGYDFSPLCPQPHDGSRVPGKMQAILALRNRSRWGEP